jgi:hypothetical protein
MMTKPISLTSQPIVLFSLPCYSAALSTKDQNMRAEGLPTSRLRKMCAASCAEHTRFLMFCCFILVFLILISMHFHN